MSSRQAHSQKVGPLSKAERERYFRRQKEWLKWLATELKTENGRRLAREIDVSRRQRTRPGRRVGKSGPSFTKQGIYASQETLAARLAKQLVRDKADVRLVRRTTKLLVKVGALRVEPRSGSTNLLYRCWKESPVRRRGDQERREDGGVRNPGR